MEWAAELGVGERVVKSALHTVLADSGSSQNRLRAHFRGRDVSSIGSGLDSAVRGRWHRLKAWTYWALPEEKAWSSIYLKYEL